MMKFYAALVVFIGLFVTVGHAQIALPYIESFDSYTTNQPLNGDGGIASSIHVYVTPHGIVGNCAEFQMTDTAVTKTDTITSPLIGPLTAHTATSFYFRVVTFTGGVPSVYHMTAADQATIYVGGAGGTGSLYIPQYTIDSTNQNASTNYVKVVVGAPSWVNGLTGKFKIITSNPAGHNWKLEFDSLVVRDTLTVVVPPVLRDSVTNISCRGQSTGGIKVIASGATPPYHYLWSPGGATTASISNQPAGTYTVTVTDSLGATATLTDTIKEPAYALLLDSLSKSAVLCNGSNTGSATIYASGGTLPYQYAWNTTPTIHTDSAEHLPAGNYTVTVTDAHGCNLSASALITEPTLLTLTVSSTASSGSDGTATAIANGGTSPFHYLWSDNQTNPIATGLAPGLFVVTVTDGNGCTLSDTVIVPHPNGVSEINEHFSIYPNPASDQVYITMQGINVSLLSVAIMDVSGRIVLSQEASTIINTSHLAEGIYIIKLGTDKGTYLSRLVIQR